MRREFDPQRESENMRSDAVAEMHGAQPGALLNEYANCNQNQLGAVANELEKGNKFLSSAASAAIERTNSGEVKSITFKAGILDFWHHSGSVTLFKMNSDQANSLKYGEVLK